LGKDEGEGERKDEGGGMKEEETEARSQESGVRIKGEQPIANS
jgi:hypothetical protein